MSPCGTPIPVNVRVIAATNRDLESAYRDGDFRKDLFFRLNVVTIHMPSLRERKSDIPTLVHWFLDKYAPKQMVQVSSEAMKCMLNYEWPGNVRELENCIERAVAIEYLEERKVLHKPERRQSRVVGLLVARERPIVARNFAAYALSVSCRMGTGANAGSASFSFLSTNARCYADPFLDGHNRMKVALELLGRIDAAHVRPPLQPVPEADRNALRAALQEAGIHA